MESCSYFVQSVKDAYGKVLSYQFVDKNGRILRASASKSKVLAFADGYTLALNEIFIQI